MSLKHKVLGRIDILTEIRSLALNGKLTKGHVERAIRDMRKMNDFEIEHIAKSQMISEYLDKNVELLEHYKFTLKYRTQNLT